MQAIRLTNNSFSPELLPFVDPYAIYGPSNREDQTISYCKRPVRTSPVTWKTYRPFFYKTVPRNLTGTFEQVRKPNVYMLGGI
jgi:hypothetical protein